MRIRLAAIGLFAAAVVSVAQPTGRLAVSKNGHFLQYEDGRPFFWLGDTGWLLLEKLDREETQRYLDDRQHKGFNVVQVMLLHSAAARSANGIAALIDRDAGKPNVTPGADPAKPGEYDYWDNLDWALDQAASRGIYLALVPAWGAVVKAGQLNPGNVVAYASFLAHRYKDKPNAIWVTGGDIPGDQHIDVWKQLGRTLKAEDPAHLITYHPFGRTQSSTWFHNEPWLDFNMFQSGHQRYDQDTDSPHKYGEDNWRYVQADYTKTPVKPVVDGEPSYEGIPQGLHDTTQPYWNDADCRRYAYWSVFAGAFGHTYGDNVIMQFFRTGAGRGSFGPKKSWTEAIDDPGAGQMQFLKALMLSRPYFERVPDQSLIAGENGTKHDYVIATRGAGYAFAYDYTGHPFEMKLGVISGAEVEGWWYNPRDGSSQLIGTFENQGTRAFTPPGKPREGNDWVLVLDDVSRKFAAPGK
jgi:hypothetical protein